MTTATPTATATDAAVTTAWLHVLARGGRTVVAGSRSGLPLGLRQLRPRTGDGGALRVGLVQTGAMLVGGDDVRLEVRVGPGARLILQDISATLAHPMGADQPIACQRLDVQVADGGRVVLAEEPLVIARTARVERDVRITLHGDARAVHRDTLVLGRHGEDGGALVARTRVTRDGRPLLDDTLDTRIAASALRSSAVLGGARVVASLAAFGHDTDMAVPDDAFVLGEADALLRRLATGVRQLAGLDRFQSVLTAEIAA